jgi:hypothetical protein
MMLTSPDRLRAVMRQFWSAPWLRGLELRNQIKRIDVLGPNAAVVVRTATSEVESAGKRRTFHQIWTGTWQNLGGRWVVMPQHASTVPRGP